MGLNAWQSKLWHRVESPWNSLFLSSSESEFVDLYSSLFTRARNTELFAQLICSPDGWNLLGPKEEWFRTTPRSLWTSRLQEDFSTTAGCCHHPFHPLHCQDAKKIRRDFFFWLLGQYYSEHILLMVIMDIMELWPHFLFQLQLSVGGEKLASQVVCSWNPARQDNICTR